MKNPVSVVTDDGRLAIIDINEVVGITYHPEAGNHQAGLSVRMRLSGQIDLHGKRAELMCARLVEIIKER